MVGHPNGTEHIFDAAIKGSLAGVKYWYAKDPTSIHRKNAYDRNNTPLHYASEKGHLAIVQFLLSNGVDVDAGDSHNLTPLMLASIKGHVAVVEALLDKGADANHRNIHNRTPLQAAVAYNHLAVVKALRERGADRS